MSPREAQRVLEALAAGIDPTTQQALPAIPVLNHPGVIRALFLGAKALAATSMDSGSSDSLHGISSPHGHMAGRPWSAAQDQALLRAFDAGLPLERLAIENGRPPRGIAARLVRLGRINERSDIYVKAQLSGFTSAATTTIRPERAAVAMPAAQACEVGAPTGSAT
jgi:hypothetical protein